MATLMCLFLLLLNLTTALPNPAPVADAGTDLNTRQLAEYCFRGWDEVDFKGNTAEACCTKPCCPIDSDLLKFHLYSAWATESGSGGVRLWPSEEWCEGDNSLWVDFKGWDDLSWAPAYYFMSVN